MVLRGTSLKRAELLRPHPGLEAPQTLAAARRRLCAATVSVYILRADVELPGKGWGGGTGFDVRAMVDK